MPKQTTKKKKGGKKAKTSKGGSKGKKNQGPCWNGYHRNSKKAFTKGSCEKN
jgi:hypothetical protein